MPPASVDQDNKRSIDLANLDQYRADLAPIDQELSAIELEAKSADPLGFCLERHPDRLDECAHSLDEIVLISDDLGEAFTNFHSIQQMYLQTITLSEQLTSTWSISILAVALAVRVIYELAQLGRGNIAFASLGYDIIFYSMLTGAYVLLIKLIVSFYLDISSYFSSEVLLHRIREHLGILRLHIENRLDYSIDLFSGITTNLIETSLAVFTSFFSFFVRIFQYFVLLAHGIIFTIVVIAGTIVVPVSVAGYVNLIGGWSRMFATVILYPIVQALMFWALLSYFDNAGLLELDQDALFVQTFELHFVENLINISIIAIFLVAPFATNIVVTGSGNLASVLTPMYLSGALIARRAGAAATSFVSGEPAKSFGNHGDDSGREPATGKTGTDDSAEATLAGNESVAYETKRQDRGDNEQQSQSSGGSRPAAQPVTKPGSAAAEKPQSLTEGFATGYQPEGDVPADSRDTAANRWTNEIGADDNRIDTRGSEGGGSVRSQVKVKDESTSDTTESDDLFSLAGATDELESHIGIVFPEELADANDRSAAGNRELGGSAGKEDKA